MLPIQAAAVRRQRIYGQLADVDPAAILPATSFTYDDEGDVCDDCYANLIHCDSTAACCKSDKHAHKELGQCKCYV
jgi:hypothetical protein